MVYFVGIWVRGSFPRIRIDQMNQLNWKFITPLALVSLMVTAVVEKLVVDMGLIRIGVHLGTNLLVLALTLWALRAYARAVRKRVENPMGSQTQAVGQSISVE
jgi:NADH-quinone oxidoreductase subunit H